MNQGALTHYSNLLLTIYRQAHECPLEQFQGTVIGLLKSHHQESLTSVSQRHGVGWAAPEALGAGQDGLSGLASHLMQALAINRRIHLERQHKDQVQAKWCLAIADPRGLLYQADNRFLELVYAAWRCSDEERLPSALLALLLDPTHPAAQVSRNGVIVQYNHDQGLLFLRARCSEPVDTLSEREFLVARMIASGLTHKQVATQLERSPETIRTQIRAIFNKLSINNVAMLGAILAVRDS